VKSPAAEARYRCAADVGWAVELHGITLTVSNRGAVCFLGYPAAAVWDLTVRGSSSQRTARLLASIAGLEPAAAERLVASQLQEWCERGWLNEGAGDD
jgi:hypothetical protein